LDDFFVVYGIPAGAALAVDMGLLFGATRSIRRFWRRNEVAPDELTATVTADAA
jgi:Zn-dependent protease with chaperone function